MAIELFMHFQNFAACSASGSFFDFPPWYKYLDCSGGMITLGQGQSIFDTLPLIGLAVVEIALRIAGMAAVIFVIYGGVSYVISQGDANEIAKAKGTIINALVGLLLAIFSVAIVNYVGSKLV